MRDGHNDFKVPSRMFKKAAQRGRSERGCVNPLQPEEQWAPKTVEPLSEARTKLEAFSTSCYCAEKDRSKCTTPVPSIIFNRRLVPSTITRPKFENPPSL